MKLCACVSVPTTVLQRKPQSLLPSSLNPHLSCAQELPPEPDASQYTTIPAAFSRQVYIPYPSRLPLRGQAILN